MDNIKYTADNVNGKLVIIAYKSDDNSVIGRLRLNPIDDGYKIDSISVKKEYRNKGIGKKLYLLAYKYIPQNVYSDDHQTPAAKSIWKFLVNNNKAEELKNGTYRMNKEEKINEMQDKEIKYWATYYHIFKQLKDDPEEKYNELKDKLEGESLNALEYFFELMVNNKV